MRSIRDACATLNAAIASYFAAALSLDAAQVLTLPLTGLEGLRRSDLIFSVGRLAGLEAGGRIWLAGCVLAFEVIAAGVFVLYLLNRLSGAAPTKAMREILQAALILVAALSVAAAVPALMTADLMSIRLVALHLGLAGGAALLDLAERRATTAGTGETGRPTPHRRRHRQRRDGTMHPSTGGSRHPADDPGPLPVLDRDHASKQRHTRRGRVDLGRSPATRRGGQLDAARRNR